MRRTKENKSDIHPVVSVIIPVYNAEKYLGQMLESVLTQTMEKIEVICVNDGSTDKSTDIIKKFMKMDSRISLLEQPRINAGTARNKGLLKAQGTYIVFWDADDRFDRKALEIMHRKAEKTKADICICGVCEFTGEGKVYETDGYLKVDRLPKKDPFNKFDVRECLFDLGANVVWNKMYRREFLMRNNLCFQEIRQANDTAFVIVSMYLAEAITCVNKKLAFYRVDNQNSLTGRASETIFCPYQSYLFTMQELEKYPEVSLVRKSFKNKAVKGMFRSLNIQTSFEAYKELYQFLQKEGLRELKIDQCSADELEEEWMYTDLEMIKTMPAEEFLLYKANERRKDRDQLKYTLRRVRRRLALLLALNQKLKKLKGINVRRRAK